MDNFNLNGELGSSNSSNLVQVSRYGRKVKQKKYFSCEDYTKVENYVRQNQENSKAVENQKFKINSKFCVMCKYLCIKCTIHKQN